MIQPNELRTGNILQIRSAPKADYTYHKVIRIEEVTLRLAAYPDETRVSDIEYSNEHLKPILLTAEWLERLGFELRLQYWEPFVGYAKGAWYRKDDLFLVVLKESGKIYQAVATNGDEFGYTYGQEITSVHQLQNLHFALTGLEFTVNRPA